MDYTNLFIELLKLSPFVACLFLFLLTVWNTMRKTNDALITTMKEHSASQLAMHEKSLLAQNNMADSNREVAHSITDMKAGIVQSHEELVKEISDLRYSKLNGRPTATRKATPTPTA